MQDTRLYQALAAATAVATFALIVLGGVVRITGSGMGCGDDWPLCNGQVMPALDFHTAIELSHRVAAGGVSILVGGLLILSWVRHRRRAPLRNASTLAAGLLAIQIFLGAVTVWLELPPASVILHLGTAMALLGTLVVATLRGGGAVGPPRRDRYSKSATIAAGAALTVVLLGALVANLDAGMACVGFPLCNGTPLPRGSGLVHLNWTHRLLAYGFAGFVLFLPMLAQRHRERDLGIRSLAWTMVALVATQLVVAATMVLSVIPPALRVIHLGVGTAVWVAAVALAVRARHSTGESAPAAPVVTAVGGVAPAQEAMR